MTALLYTLAFIGVFFGPFGIWVCVVGIKGWRESVKEHHRGDC